MSTMNSTSMSVNRPTTKVTHAPGGASSISIFGEPEQRPAAGGSGARPTFKASFEPSFETSAPPLPTSESVKKAVIEPVHAPPEDSAAGQALPLTQESDKTSVATPADVPHSNVISSSKTAATTMNDCGISPNNTSAGVGIYVVFAATSHLQTALKARTLEMAAAQGVPSGAVEVCDLLQLPLAAKRMAATEKYAAIIATAAITEEDSFVAKEMAGAVANGLVQVSCATSVPVIPGLIIARSEAEVLAMMEEKPAAWVASALSFSQGLDPAVEVMDARGAAGAVEASFPAKTAEESAPDAINAPEKEVITAPSFTEPVGEASLGVIAKATAAFVPSEGNAPPRRPNHRGAGPSSIVFG
ncbi:6,7-dimethyl-8-ribityllumazine synthase [Nannochloropsis gaditana]|uniref:6,7-dimethyl-8-ribityllumazine synthase n=1 Tax=Nannochloropsis gaditana TaxID=72520 RepID=W7TRF9_9STRA|nr:6,7-dimethyl-8-ribityllumazine synthase [Nannochloropsis gaditana]